MDRPGAGSSRSPRPSRSRSGSPRAVRVARVDGLALTIIGRSGAAVVGLQSSSARRSTQRLLVLKKRRSMSANASSPSGPARSRAARAGRRAPGEVAALAVGGRAADGLHHERDLLRGQPGGDPGRRRRGCRCWTRRRSGSRRRAGRRACRRPPARCRCRRVRAGTTRGRGRRATDRLEVVGAELGLAVLQEVQRHARRAQVAVVGEHLATVAGVRKFMKTSGSRTPYRSRSASTCRAMMSRKFVPG